MRKVEEWGVPSQPEGARSGAPEELNVVHGSTATVAVGPHEHHRIFGKTCRKNGVNVHTTE
jgi:hypothetical protein